MKLNQRVTTPLGEGVIVGFENMVFNTSLDSGEYGKNLLVQDEFTKSAYNWTIRVIIKLDNPENWSFYPEQENPYFFLKEVK